MTGDCDQRNEVRAQKRYGMTCQPLCMTDSDCGPGLECLCDDVCGLSCIDPGTKICPFKLS